MKAQNESAQPLAQTGLPLWQLFRFILWHILPRALRDEYADAVYDLRNQPLRRQVTDAASLLADAYGGLAPVAINKYGLAAELLLSTLLLAAVASARVSIAAWLPLGAILAALSGRDIWAHRIKSREKTMPSESQYYLDSAIDAMCATVSLLFAEVCAWLISPQWALPGRLLYRMAVVFLPLVSVLRMSFRPKPDPDPTAQWRDMAPLGVAQRTWVRTLGWNFLFYLTLSMNASTIPGYFPDKLRGFLPGLTLLVWLAYQRDGLSGRTILITIRNAYEKVILKKWKTRLAVRVPGKDVHWSAKVADLLVYG